MQRHSSDANVAASCCVLAAFSVGRDEIDAALEEHADHASVRRTCGIAIDVINAGAENEKRLVST